MTPSGWWEGRVRGEGWRGSTSQSRLLAGPGWLGWAGTLWIAAASSRSDLHWSWLSRAASPRGWAQGGDTAWLFLATEFGLQGQHEWTLPGAGTAWMGSPWGSVYLHLTSLCVPSHTVTTHRRRASRCAQWLLHPRGEQQNYSGAWSFYLVLLSQKMHLSLQT